MEATNRTGSTSPEPISPEPDTGSDIPALAPRVPARPDTSAEPDATDVGAAETTAPAEATATVTTDSDPTTPVAAEPTEEPPAGETTPEEAAEETPTEPAEEETGEEGEEEAGPSEEDRWAAFAPLPERPPGRIRRALSAVGAALIHEWTLVSVGAALLAVVMTWPALRYPQYTLPQDTGDPTLVAWLLAWPGHILLTDPGQLWHTNAFYPERWSYAFTDTLLGYAPASLLGEGPADAILRYNILFVLAHALAFVGGYVLARQLGTGPIPALVLALAFAYAPWRMTQAGHLHVLSTGGIALSLAMLARGNGWSLRRGFQPKKVRPVWIMAGWLVAAWQITLGFGIGLPFGYVLAGICLVVAVAWVVRRILRRPRQRIGRVVTVNLIGGGLFAAVCGLMALPYLTVVEQHPHARRDFQLLEAFSPPLQGFVTAPEQSWLWGALHAGPRAELAWAPEMALLPGFALIGLAATGLVFSVWSWRVRLGLAIGVVVSVGLAMGTQLLDGEIYRLLHEHLPGWDALRTPGRLVIWTTLLLGVLAAGAVAAFLARARELSLSHGYPRPRPWLRVAALVPVALVLVEGINTIPHPVVPPPPAAWATVEGPVLVLPSDQLTDMRVMLWSTDRFVPLINGGSGFTPTSLHETRQITASFPDEASVSHLRALGVETVLVLPEAVGTPWEGALTATGDRLGIAREEQDDGVVVFHLNPEPGDLSDLGGLPGPGNQPGPGGQPGPGLTPGPRPTVPPGPPSDR